MISEPIIASPTSAHAWLLVRQGAYLVLVGSSMTRPGNTVPAVCPPSATGSCVTVTKNPDKDGESLEVGEQERDRETLTKSMLSNILCESMVDRMSASTSWFFFVSVLSFSFSLEYILTSLFDWQLCRSCYSLNQDPNIRSFTYNVSRSATI